MKRSLDDWDIENSGSNKTQKPLTLQEKLKEVLTFFATQADNHSVDNTPSKILDQYEQLEQWKRLEETLHSLEREGIENKALMNILKEIPHEQTIQNIVAILTILNRGGIYPSISRFIGLAYQNGTGVAKDETRASTYFSDAANNGNVHAWCDLGVYYLNEFSIEKNEETAFTYFTHALNNGCVQAYYHVGNCYLRGKGIKQDVEKAVGYFEEAVKQGSIQAIEYLADCYLKGIGVEKNQEKAFECYMKGVNNGSASAMYMVSNCYRNGIGVEKNQEKAFEWELKAADHGHHPSIYNTAMRYWNGVGVDENPGKAFEYFSKSEGHHEALFYMGVCYKDGKGVEKNETLAFECFKQSAEKNNPDALYELAVFYEEGKGGIRKNKKQALHYFKESERFGSVRGKFRIGQYYEKGKKVDGRRQKDSEQAMFCYQEASLLGHEEATVSLKRLFEERCKKHEDNINNTNEKIKGTTLTKKCEEYLNAKKTLGQKLALWRFIGSQNKSDLMRMLVDMSAENGIDNNLLKALRMHPDPSVSLMVAVPSMITIIDKKTGKIKAVKPNIVKKGDSPKDIPIILKEAYKVPGDLRKDFFNAAEFLPQISGGMQESGAILPVLPAPIQSEILSYFPVRLPVREDIDNNTEKGTLERSIVQTVLSKHTALHRDGPFRFLFDALCKFIKSDMLNDNQRESAVTAINTVLGLNDEKEKITPDDIEGQLKENPRKLDFYKFLESVQENLLDEGHPLKTFKDHRDGLSTQSGKIDDLEAFGKEVYANETPKIKPVALEIIEIAEEKEENRVEALKNVDKRHETFLEKRGEAVESWTKKIQEERQQKQEPGQELVDIYLS